MSSAAMTAGTSHETEGAGRSVSSALQNLAYAVGPYAVLIALWEGVRILIAAGPQAMPSMASVAGAIVRVAKNGILPEYISSSVLSILEAAAISIALGITLGIGIGMSETMASYAVAVLRYFNSISGIAWLPLFLIWFGFNQFTVLATISYTFLFPVVFNTVTGVRTVPRVFRNAVLTMGGSWWDVITDVLLPGALPSILAGTRMGFGYGWRAVIAAEILVGTGGLGYMIFKAQAGNLTDRILAGMVIIGVVWSLMDYFILQPLEDATIKRWELIQR